MKNIAIIPLRANSKGIKNKNKKKMLGRALYQWTLGAAIESNLDKVYIYTDDKEVFENVTNEYIWTEKVEALLRSDESATDTASTEMAMIEFAKRINFDFTTITLIQATSPLTNANDINRVLDKVISQGCDSALTVVNSKRFIWSSQGDSVNYDYLKRPRRQDFDGLLIENGAAYTATKECFIENQNRLGGKIGLVEMPEDTLSEIDEPADWDIIATLLKNRLGKLKETPQFIKYIVMDVDGVFTDGKVATSPEGELFKMFSLRDGMGLELMRSAGVEPIVMTSENSPIVKKRMEKLKIESLFLGVKDKFARLNNILKQLDVKRSEIAYIGDDINDMANICSVGWSFAPNDAIDKVKLNVDIVLNEKGGDKAIREAVEFILEQNIRFK